MNTITLVLGLIIFLAIGAILVIGVSSFSVPFVSAINEQAISIVCDIPLDENTQAMIPIELEC